MEDDKILRMSIIGGRCYPLQRDFESKHYAECMEIINDKKLADSEKRNKIKLIYKR